MEPTEVSTRKLIVVTDTIKTVDGIRWHFRWLRHLLGPNGDGAQDAHGLLLRATFLQIRTETIQTMEGFKLILNDMVRVSSLLVLTAGLTKEGNERSPQPIGRQDPIIVKCP